MIDTILLYKGASGNNQVIGQAQQRVPMGEWVHFEALYEQTQISNGTVRIWMNGELLHEAVGYPTMLSGRTIFWSVNNYGDGISPSPAGIYIDDVMIASDRTGMDYPYPPYGE